MELMEQILIFFAFFIFPMAAICTIPALLMGGIILNMTEKNKEENK
jgi:hypothetical protein